MNDHITGPSQPWPQPDASSAPEVLAPAPAPWVPGPGAPLPTEPSEEAPAPRKARAGWRKWTLRSVVAVVIVGLLGTSAYLTVVSRQWSDRVDELTAISEDLGSQVATERAAKEQAQSQATEVQSQLDTLKGRVSELANEEANAQDHQDALTNYLDAMISCADQRGEVLDHFYGYTWTNSDGRSLSSRQYAAELTTYCEEIKQNYADYKADAGS